MQIHRLLWGFALLLCIAACASPEAQKPSDPVPPVGGLFPPVDLLPDTTLLVMRDYFPMGNFPDSVLVPKGMAAQAFPERGILLLWPNGDSLPWLGSLAFKFGDIQYDVLLRRSRKRRTILRFDPTGAPYKNVQVAGEMTNWNPGQGPMQLVNGKWETSFLLNPGTYQYQFVADGAWMLDPANTRTVGNGMGGFNSEIVVGSPAANAVPLPLLSTYDYDAEGLRVMVRGKAKTKVEDIFAFYENERLQLEASDPTEGGYLFRIPIPAKSTVRRRAHIRVWARTPDGWTNDLLVPLENGKVLTDPTRLGPADQHANILYFLMVDRFFNGDTTNDRPVPDPEVHPKANYHGGDLAGILAQLRRGYFDSLGVNMLWLSPIVQNPDSAFREWPAPQRKYSGYHGYWPVASGKIDHRFGTPAVLDSLVGTAHRKGQKVILDFVANHVHEQHPIMRQHPDWKTPLHLNDSSLNIRKWDSHRLTTWFDTFLPALDHAKPAVVEWQVDTAVWWIHEYNLDGYRHDATKHIEEVFWRRLTERLRTEYVLKEGKPVFQIGETFGSRELIGSYVGAGLLDAQFDFNHYFDIRGLFALDGQSIEENLVNSFRESEAYYGSHSLMGNITGNHDMPRFISYASGSLRFNEDPKAAGWERDITVGNPQGYRRLRMLTAYLAAIPGLPVIYYGDEIGMPGADDPDNRRDMRFGGLSPEEVLTKQVCGQLMHLRQRHMAALYGETDMRVTGRVLVIHRHYFEDDLWFIFNFDALPATVPSPAYGLRPLVSNTPMQEQNLVLPGWSFEVLGRGK